MQVPDLLRIALATAGKYDANDKKLLDDAWTLVRDRMGNSTSETFDSLDECLHTLVAEGDIRLPLVASDRAQLVLV
jgi:hypothetical protein